jgi:GAF domain-containing protein
MAHTEPPDTGGDPASAATIDFFETASAVFSAGSVGDTLAEVVSLAVATIEGCDFAGIFVVEDGAVVTPVHTHPDVVDLDSLQQVSGEGPCLDALAQGVTVYADDLSIDARWPAFGPSATARGIRSLLALPLLANRPPGESLGALNLYGRYPQAFGVIDRARGLLLGALAALALSIARTHEDDERQVANLHAALATREVIGQAQGILMERERISADSAFDILRRASQHLNVKLRQVAQDLVDTGERPETGERSDASDDRP